MRRNKAANSIFGLIAMYDGLIEYLIEMGNSWCNTRSIPPLLENFYNGPENSVFLSGIIGYASTTAKKQLQTRIGLMELEQVTQYLNIAGGMSLYGKNIHSKIISPLQHQFYLCNIRICKNKRGMIDTKNNSEDITYPFLVQKTSRKRNIQVPYLMGHSLQLGSLTPNGKNYPECKLESFFYENWLNFHFQRKWRKCKKLLVLI